MFKIFLKYRQIVSLDMLIIMLLLKTKEEWAF